MELDNTIRLEILADLRKTRAPSRTAKNLGYDIRTILEIANEDRHPASRHEERHDGLGRPELRIYTVSRKKAWEAWDNDSNSLKAARASYEAGTHDMLTGRDGEWLILYLIPQKRVTPRVNYFQPEISL